MPRRAEGRLRDRLLSAAVDYVRTSDAPDFSLRDLAGSIGTSHRMLVYHFGSREALLIEIVRAFEAEQSARMRALLDDDTLPMMERLQEVWRGFSSPEMWPRERLFFAVCGYALQGRDDTREFLHELVDTWLAPLEIVAGKIGVGSEERRSSAGLFLAVTRGLLLSLLASGNLREVEATMQHFLANNAPLRAYAGISDESSPSASVA